MRNIYLSRKKQIFGPIDIETLYQWLDQGNVKYSDWIWIPESNDWYPVLQIPQLAEYFFSKEDKPDFSPEMKSEDSAQGTIMYTSSEKVQFNNEGIEKRTFRRHSMSLPVYYTKHIDFTSYEVKMNESTTIDISKLGIGFISKIKFEIGDEIDIIVDIFPDKFKCLAKVVRIRETKKGYRIGAKFFKYEEADIDILKKFIEYS